MPVYNEEICGKCLYHRKQNEEWVCTNLDSECYGCWTEYRDGCDSFEERSGKLTFSVEIIKSLKNLKKCFTFRSNRSTIGLVRR